MKVAVAKDGRAPADAEPLRGDAKVVEIAATRHGRAPEHASAALKADVDVANASERSRNEAEAVKAAVMQGSRALESASAEMRSDADVRRITGR